MVDTSHVRAGRMMRLFSASAHREGQLAMPGFGETDFDGPALPLALYGLGDTNLQHGGGRGAPLALRLFVEAVLAVRLEDRRNRQLFQLIRGKRADMHDFNARSDAY